jgi:hypothetical protein
MRCYDYVVKVAVCLVCFLGIKISRLYMIKGKDIRDVRMRRGLDMGLASLSYRAPLLFARSARSRLRTLPSLQPALRHPPPASGKIMSI